MQVVGNHIKQENEFLIANYNYNNSTVTKQDNKLIITPKSTQYTFKTNTKVPKLGVMLVGWGGNNGTTFTGGVLANK
jgi:myo-inositol-1-phosphate synthase